MKEKKVSYKIDEVEKVFLSSLKKSYSITLLDLLVLARGRLKDQCDSCLIDSDLIKLGEVQSLIDDVTGVLKGGC